MSVSYDLDERTPSNKLPVLTESGENFPSWKAEIESAVIGKGLMRYKDGRAKPPVAPASLSNSEMLNPTQLAAYEA